MSFENKVVLVTGAGAGIGAATVQLFTKEGAKVVIVDNNEERANKTADKCKQFDDKIICKVGDVSEERKANEILAHTIQIFGRLDILVNNAGIVKAGKIFNGTILHEFDEVMKNNLRSVVVMTSLAVPYLMNTKGCIVNVSSITSSEVRTGSEYPSYCVSKAAVDCFTKLSALELASSGVRVNAVNPGPVNTNILRHAGIDDSTANYANSTALRTVAEPEEVAQLILYLASDKARCITGSCYVVDCGMGLI